MEKAFLIINVKPSRLGWDIPFKFKKTLFNNEYLYNYKKISTLDRTINILFIKQLNDYKLGIPEP